MTSDTSQEQEGRILKDDELDTVSGGLTATTYYAGVESSAFLTTYWSPILLPPSPC